MNTASDRRGRLLTRIRHGASSTSGWMLVLFVFAVLMFAGAQRDASPATPQERVEVIARRLACPTCAGESVAESRGTASQAIRQEITRLVNDGRLSDEQIVVTIDDSYAENLRLTPGSSGIEAMVWILPIVIALGAASVLIAAFRRWTRAHEGTHIDVVLDLPDESAVGRERFPKNRFRAALATVVVLGLGAVIAVVLTRSDGDRQLGQSMTGGIEDSSVSSLLVRARSLGMSDVSTALDLYAQVLAQEPDNIEALTYFGWLSVLSATQIEDQALAASRLDSGLVLLRQATIVDSSYPDAHCFLGISFFRFLDDARAAQPEIEACLEANPPAQVASLVEGLADRIAQSLDVPSDSDVPTSGDTPEG